MNAITTDTTEAWAGYTAALQAFQDAPSEATGAACVEAYRQWCRLYLISETETHRLVQAVRFNVAKTLALHKHAARHSGGQHKGETPCASAA